MLQSIENKQQWHAMQRAKRLEHPLLTLPFNTFSCQNYFFQRVWGLYIKLVEIPEGGGVLCSKNGNSWEEGGEELA